MFCCCFAVVAVVAVVVVAVVAVVVAVAVAVVAVIAVSVFVISVIAVIYSSCYDWSTARRKLIEIDKKHESLQSSSYRVSL